MSKDTISDNDFYNTKLNHMVGEQPHKVMSRKIKKDKFFSRFEHEAGDIEFDKHRQNYKRAAAKYSTRIQLHSNEVIF